MYYIIPNDNYLKYGHYLPLREGILAPSLPQLKITQSFSGLAEL